MLSPMDTKEFERIVALGLGRAVLHLREHDSAPHRQVILDACLHSKAYDAQVEGSRAEYMLDLMRASGELWFYVSEVNASLAEAADDWDSYQRFRIVRLLAQGGERGAREAMYSAFRSKSTSSSDIATEFVELDGIKGLIFVLGRIGEQLTQDANRWEDDYLLSVAGDACGQAAVDSALRNAALTDKNIKEYMAAVEANRALRGSKQKSDPAGLSYGDVRSLIEANKAGGVLVKWGQTASDSELEAAARDLVHETDPAKLKSYLRIFRKRQFPLDCDHLLRLAALSDGPIPRHAMRALVNLEHERIRSLAFTLTQTNSRLRGYAIDLLIKNFRNGDHSVVQGWCEAERDQDEVNAFDRSLREFFKAHPHRESEVHILNTFYEKEPCSHCRGSVIERLIDLGGLSDAHRRECEFDSYLETRDLVKA
jgi:hypothetical protein